LVAIWFGGVGTLVMWTVVSSGGWRINIQNPTVEIALSLLVIAFIGVWLSWSAVRELRALRRSGDADDDHANAPSGKANEI